MDKTKICSKCNAVKATSEFYRGAVCKDCAKEREKLKRLELKNVIIDPNQTKLCKGCGKSQSSKMFRPNRRKCLDCERAHGRNYRHTDVGKAKAEQWVENNQDKMTKLQAEWYQKSKPKINKKYNDRYKNDKTFKLMKDIKSRIRMALSRNKDDDVVPYIGCTKKFYQKWLDFCFDPPMDFDNHGAIWHIDHVIPINNFDLNKQSDIDACFNWKNTMPILGRNNLSKHDKLDLTQIRLHNCNLITFHRVFDLEEPKQFNKLYARHLNNREVP